MVQLFAPRTMQEGLAIFYTSSGGVLGVLDDICNACSQGFVGLRRSGLVQAGI
jgi:hypothetical protein